MNQICNTRKIETDENNYLKDRTLCKVCYKKIEEKTTITPQFKINNQKSIKSTISMRTTLMFQPLLAQETLVKLITRSKC